MATITDRIREALAVKGIKKGEFYQNVGIDSQSMRNWEHQKSIPRADTAIKMAEYLGVSVKWLIFGEDDNFSNEEIELINQYRLLNQKDRDEILDIILLKIENQKKGEDSYSLANA